MDRSRAPAPQGGCTTIILPAARILLSMDVRHTPVRETLTVTGVAARQRPPSAPRYQRRAGRSAAPDSGPVRTGRE
jgi:hypothetical protein